MTEKRFSREELISGGLNRSRRAAKLLSAIEGRCLYMRDESQRVVAAYLLDGDEDFKRRFDVNYIQSVKLTTASTEALLPDHLERFAPQWKPLVPADPELRATILHLIGRKYGLGPATLAALGGAEQEVQAAYRQLFGGSVEDLGSGPGAGPAQSPVAAPKAWQDVEARLEWLSLASRETLFRAGDPGDALYVIISGRLRATITGEDGAERVLEEMGRGELVGEMGVLMGEARSATVTAVRDSELVRLARSDLLALSQHHLEVMIRINALLARRMRKQEAGRGLADSVLLTLALIPCDASVPLQDFGRQLVQALGQFGSAMYVTGANLDEAVGPGAAQAALDDPRNAEIVSWLSEIESRSRCGVYEGAPEVSEWSQRCIRQADRILLVGRAGASPEPAAHEVALLPAEPLTPPGAGVHPQKRVGRVELVLLHSPDAASTRGTALWLAPRPLRAHHHLRLGNLADMSRLARSLTGHAVGLVLSGGGARGFGHIGALRALREAGVPVDEVGGTSMGALMSAGYAMGMDDAALQELAMRVGSRKALLDQTLPIISFYATRKITDLIRSLTSDLDIEDLWLPSFYISCNLSKGEQMVHDRGLLWRAVRASMAAAPIFTPILDHGDLLVDGGFLNNLPVDVMRQRLGDATVLGIDCSPISPKTRPYEFGPSISGWEALRYQVIPSYRQKSPPNMLAIFSQIMDTNGLYRLRFIRDAADLIIRLPARNYGMLDFDHCAEILETGYRATAEQLAAWLPRYQKN